MKKNEIYDEIERLLKDPSTSDDAKKRLKLSLELAKKADKRSEEFAKIFGIKYDVNEGLYESGE